MSATGGLLIRYVGKVRDRSLRFVQGHEKEDNNNNNAAYRSSTETVPAEGCLFRQPIPSAHPPYELDAPQPFVSSAVFATWFELPLTLAVPWLLGTKSTQILIARLIINPTFLQEQSLYGHVRLWPLSLFCLLCCAQCWQFGILSAIAYLIRLWISFSQFSFPTFLLYILKLCISNCIILAYSATFILWFATIGRAQTVVSFLNLMHFGVQLTTLIYHETLLALTHSELAFLFVILSLFVQAVI